MLKVTKPFPTTILKENETFRSYLGSDH